MTFAARFAENLNRHRKRSGLTQEEVAIRASISRGAVNKYETRANVPGLDIVVRLGGALSIPPADLLEGITYRPGFVGLGEGRYDISDSGHPPDQMARRVTTRRAGTRRRSSAEPRRG